MRVVRIILIIFLFLFGFSQTTEIHAQSSTKKTQQKEQIVYVADTGEKYHGTNCGYLRSSKNAIQLSKAQAQGYTACSRCKGSNSYYPKSSSSSSSVRCSGITKAGNRCKRMTKSSSGRCYQH